MKIKTKRFLSGLFAVIVTAALMLLFSGCIFGGGWFYDSDDEIARQNIEKLVDSLEVQDRDGLKKLFAQGKMAEAENFDSRITQLFDYYGGEYLSHRCTKVVSEDIYGGYSVKDFMMSCDVTTTECVYRFGIVWRIKDTLEKSNVGIWSLYAIKYDDDPFQKYAYWGDGNKALGISIGKTYSPEYLDYCVWTEESGKMTFRTVSNGVGSGTLLLGERQIEAQFVFIGGQLEVSVFADDLNGYTEGERLGVITQTVELCQMDKYGKIYSVSGEVNLFGWDLGKLCLTLTELESVEDFDSIEECEYYYPWQANLPVNSGGDCTFTLDEPCRGYFKRKCWTATVYTAGGEKKAIFKWLPNDGFAFYDYDERGFADDGAKVIAAGTYQKQGNDYYLNFTQNGLFKGKIDGMNMRYDYRFRKLPQ